MFDVHIKVDTRDGKIISAQMNNPVTAISHDCIDAAWSQCGDAKPDNILREGSLMF